MNLYLAFVFASRAYGKAVRANQRPFKAAKEAARPHVQTDAQATDIARACDTLYLDGVFS